MNIQESMNTLYDCLVEDVQYDYKKAKLFLKLRDLETNQIHIVIFHDVISLLWTICEIDGEICHDIYPELSEFLLSNVSINTTDKWLKNYPLEYNVCIQIMNRALVINTKAVEIDSVIYEVI